MTALKDKLTKLAEEHEWGQLERIVDTGIRHKPDRTPQDYINHWTEIGSCFAYATRDKSFGEFEKEFAIIVKRMLKAEQKLKEAGL